MRNTLILVVIILAMVGCGPADGEATPDEPAISSETIATEAPSTEPVPDGSESYPAPVLAYPGPQTLDSYPAPGLPYPGPESQDSYPAPDLAYPGPTEIPLSSELVDVPEPSSPELATVTGVLLIGEESPEPVPAVILYLGGIVVSETGAPTMSSLNKSTAPVTRSSLVGQFIFENVPAGTYTLILDQITTSSMLNNPEGGELLIEVEGGSVIDLGELVYSELPLANQ